MPKISAIVHTCDSERSLGRALDSLRPCDEVMVVDHGSRDDSVKVAREHGARVVKAVPGVNHGVYVQDAHHDWIFCLQACEAMAEELEASLQEWKQSEPAEDQLGYNVQVREQNGAGWKTLAPQFRLVNRKQINWIEELPPDTPNAPSLPGHILRIPEKKT